MKYTFKQARDVISLKHDVYYKNLEGFFVDEKASNECVWETLNPFAIKFMEEGLEKLSKQ